MAAARESGSGRLREDRGPAEETEKKGAGAGEKAGLWEQGERMMYEGGGEEEKREPAVGLLK